MPYDHSVSLPRARCRTWCVLAELAASGVALQAVVYYRSTGAFSECATHYFVMSSTLDALIAAGALLEAVPVHGGEPCAPSNVDATKLEAYARKAVAAFVPPLAQQEMVRA